MTTSRNGSLETLNNRSIGWPRSPQWRPLPMPYMFNYMKWKLARVHCCFQRQEATLILHRQTINALIVA